MRRDNDETLFEKLLEGDAEALRPLMEAHGDACTLYVNGYVHDIDAAEDIMLEAFSRMLAKQPRLHSGGFKPYLYKTARNLALRHVRLRGRFMSIDNIDEQADITHGADVSVVRSEAASALYRCLSKIPQDYREALYLVYIEQMSYDEAGAIMRKTRKQVDNLVQRGKRAMRPLLAEEGISYEID